jgi:Flp pilus assembly pilin Flp
MMSGMRREDGQTMAEYGVVLAVLVLTAAVFVPFAGAVRASIERIVQLIP